MTNFGMQAIYNGYTLENVELETFSKEPQFTEAGTLESYNVTITVKGYVKNATAAAHAVSTTAIALALEKPKQDFYLKDAEGTPNTLYSLTPAMCLSGSGPVLKYEISDGNGFNFWLTITATGNIPPGGSGSTLVDDYKDRYTKDSTGIRTWTRTGTMRNSSAWADEAAAFTSTDPAPSASLWEFVDSDGELDSDKKLFEYSFTYQQFWKKRPSYFKKFGYTVSTSEDGRRKDIHLSATVAPEFISSGQENTDLEKQARDWARDEIPDDAIIRTIESSVSPRTGECTVGIHAIAAYNGDVIEWTQSVNRQGEVPYVIHVPLDGSAPWTVFTGGKVEETSVSGRIVGLRSYHDGDIPKPLNAYGWSTTRHDPELGPDGNLVYAVDYSYRVPENIDVGGGGDSGGSGGGASGRSGRSGAWNPSQPRNVLTFGEIGGFTTGGLVQGAVGGLFGTNPQTQIKFRIT